MCATIMCYFTMEPYEIVEEFKRNIVPQVTRFIENPLLKNNKCGIAKNQLSYCEENILRDCNYHGCGGYPCSKQRGLMRIKRDCRGVPSIFASSLNMYSTQTLPATVPMEKMYSMNDTLNGKANMSNPKKENMFHSVFNALSILWEQFSKVPASFIASINYPLSVTVVNNEGIISHDFFKNLTTKKESLGTNNAYVQNADAKESLTIVESIHSDIFDEKKLYINRIFNEGTKDYVKFNYEYIDNENKDSKFDRMESVTNTNIRCNTTNCNDLVPVQKSSKISRTEIFEYIYFDSSPQKMYAAKNCYNFEALYTKGNFSEKQFLNSNTTDQDSTRITSREISFSPPTLNEFSIQAVQQTTVSNLLTNMFQRVFRGMTDRFCKTETMDSSDMTMKRPFSPKQRRKLNTVAKGRGRGRARSQLRRSGVSQTRHRKERTKHDIVADMESDFKSWQELEMYHTGENKESEDCFSLDEDIIDGLDTVQCIIEETFNPVTYTIADVKPKLQKPKARRNIDSGICKFSARMRCIPECMVETNIFDQDFVQNKYKTQKRTFRPRLISESSMDSEDSYCIVFEAGSEVTYTSDLDDCAESDMDQTSDDDATCNDEESISSMQKVKFNLNPEVHVMVQWDYAYRAARKGPWEEMARDRERFKGRINCIARVLNPILTVQHRSHIWQERFALTE